MTRTLTEAEFVALPSGLEGGRSDVAHPGIAPTTSLNAYTTTAALLKAAGYTSSDELARVQALISAAQSEVVRSAQSVIDGLDLDTLTPDQAADAVRDAAMLLMRSHSTADTTSPLDLLVRRLLPVAKAAFSTIAEDAVQAMKPEWDSAVEKVTAAHRAGITPEHNATQMAEDATPKQVTAYRDLRTAAATLDRLASLRIRIANLTYERSNRDLFDDTYADKFVMAGFLQQPATDLTREGAVDIFRGNTETVLVQPNHASAGPGVRRIARPRLGGAWLSLVRAGYTLQLNTPKEITNA